MYFSRRWRARPLLAVAVVFCIGLYALRGGLKPAAPVNERESISLARFMNDAPPKVAAVPSSFDWSELIFEHLPPLNPTKLPQGEPVPLPPVQHDFDADGEEPPEAAAQRARRRGEVRRVFAGDWNNYRRYAWAKDSFGPMSASSRDQFSGWAATLVDSLDTLWIMGFRADFDEAVATVAQIDFGRASDNRVNTFETTIRYLGGLLGAYDLSGRKVLLVKATELGDLIYAAFNTEGYMPVDFMDFQKAKSGFGLKIEDWVVAAAPGSLSLEMTRLSQLTGDSKYYDVIDRVMHVFYEHQHTTRLPGLWPLWISMKKLDVDGRREFTLGGGVDSLYEYLPKMIALLSGREPMYATMTRNFISAATNHLFFRPMLPGGEDILIAGVADVLQNGHAPLAPESEHLSCYIGGTIALAGRMLNNPDHVTMGAKLARGCAYVYRAFNSGLMPERFAMVPCEPKRAENCPWNQDRWDAETHKHQGHSSNLPLGFSSVTDPRYLLRPEAIESIFYLYRITGEPAYQEIAWDMFQAVIKASEAAFGHAAVNDVTISITEETQQANLIDYMESFWFAETLKYFYLIFCPPDIISLDDFVLNTEAHPLRREK